MTLIVLLLILVGQDIYRVNRIVSGRFRGLDVELKWSGFVCKAYTYSPQVMWYNRYVVGTSYVVILKTHKAVISDVYSYYLVYPRIICDGRYL